MFNAKYIKNKKVYQILDTYVDELGGLWFILWDGRWQIWPASSFVPPNVEV